MKSDDSDGEDREFGGDWSPVMYTEGVISEIIPGELYLSDMAAANDIVKLKRHGIKGVISLGGLYEQMSYLVHGDPEYHLEYYQIYIEDCSSEPINEYFEDAIWFINKLSAPVLVHCFMGMSRSVSIIVAYLIKEKDMTYTEAISYVQERRTFICPNDGFLEQLEKYSEEVNVEKLIIRKTKLEVQQNLPPN